MEAVAPTSPPSRIQTRNGPRKEAEKRMRIEGDSSGAADMAPTAKLQKHKHELELMKMKIACQEDLIKELTKERDFLKDQLSQSSRNTNKRDDEPSPEASIASASSGSSELSSSSSTNSSDSSSSPSSSSSEDGKKKKKKKMKRRKKSKKNIKKKKGKKGTGERGSKRIRRSSVSRARGPDEVIARYRKVLKAYKKKKSITAACRTVGVDRNTIALNAPIAELSFAAPEKFAEFKDQHTRKHKLGDFAGKCRDAILDCPDIDDDEFGHLRNQGNCCLLGRGTFELMWC